RSLNLDEAIAHVDYTSGDLRFHREVFASNPASALVTHITCNKAASISCTVSFDKQTLPGEVTVEGNSKLILKGNAFEHLHSNGKQGVAFEAHVQVRTEGGQISADNGALHISNANAVTLHIAIASNYR